MTQGRRLLVTGIKSFQILLNPLSSRSIHACTRGSPLQLYLRPNGSQCKHLHGLQLSSTIRTLYKGSRLGGTGDDVQLQSLRESHAFYAFYRLDSVGDAVRCLVGASSIKQRLIGSKLLEISSLLSSADLQPKTLGKCFLALSIYNLKDPGVVSLIQTLKEKMKVHYKRGDYYENALLRNVCRGLENKSCRSLDVKDVLSLLVPQMYASNEPWRQIDVSLMFPGLNRMHSHTKEVRDMLKAMTFVINGLSESFDGRSINNIMYCFRGMDSSHKEVRGFLAALSERYPPPEEPLSVKNISGLVNVSCEDDEVRKFLTLLKDHLRSSTEEYSAAKVMTALSGLRSMSSDEKEVRDLVAVLSEKLEQCDASIHSPKLYRGMYGLKCMNSDSEEVRGLLRLIKDHIEQCDETFDNETITSMILGMQSMTSDYKEVRDILTTLNEKYLLSEDNMHGRLVGFAIMGVQNMSSDCKEVREILSTVTAKFSTLEGQFHSRFILSILFAMQKMNADYKEVRDILALLTKMLASAEEELDLPRVNALVSAVQNLSFDCKESDNMLAVLAGKKALLGEHHMHQSSSVVSENDHTQDAKYNQAKSWHPQNARAFYRLDSVGDAVRCLASATKEQAKLHEPQLLKISSLLSSADLQPKTLGKCFLALSIYNLKDPGVVSLIQTLKEKMKVHYKRGDYYENALLRNVCRGLENKSCRSLDVKDVLSLLVPQMYASNEPWRQIDVSLMFPGLNRMHSHTKEVRDMLKAMTFVINGLSESFDGRSINNIMYCFRGMDSSHKEVRGFLAALSERYPPPEEPLSVKNISGLVNVSCEDDEVRKFLTLLKDHLRSSTEEYSAAKVMTALSGLRSMSSDEKEVRDLVAVLSEKLEQCDASIHSPKLYRGMYGLKCMNSDSEEVRGLLRLIKDHIEQCDETFDNETITSMILGMQSMTSGYKEVRDILTILTAKVEASKDGFHAGQVLMGLRNMKNSPEVLGLVKAFADNFKNYADGNDYEFSPHEVANTLFGLQGLSSNFYHVRYLLKAIKPLLDSCKAPLYDSAASGSFTGLKNLTSDWQEVRDILSILNKLIAPTKRLRNDTLSYMLNGLNCMKGDVIEVRNTLEHLENLIPDSDERFTSRQVGMSLYGFKSMSDDVPEVKAVIKKLLPLIQNCHETLHEIDLSHAFYGIQRMSDKEEGIRELLEVLRPKANEIKDSISAKHVSNILYGLLNMQLDESWIPFLEAMLKTLANYDFSESFESYVAICQTLNIICTIELPLSKSLKEFALYDAYDEQRRRFSDMSYRYPECNNSTATNAFETRLFGLAYEVFSHMPEVSVETNVYIDGFEVDMIIRKDGHQPVNLEVDGHFHKEATTQRFTGLRDRVLQEKNGILVERWDLIEQVMEKRSDEQIIEMLQSFFREKFQNNSK